MANSLGRAACADGTGSIAMPAGIVPTFVIEPFIEADQVHVETAPVPDLVADPSLSAAFAAANSELEPSKVPDGDEEAEGADAVQLELVHNLQSATQVTRLRREEVSGLVEVTVGVYGTAGDMQAMIPSMQLKSGSVLSHDEKFQTGGGVCLTPPPPEIIPRESLLVCFCGP